MSVGGRAVEITVGQIQEGSMAAALGHTDWVSVPLLRLLADGIDPALRAAVAGHPNCPPELAEKLIENPYLYGQEPQAAIYLAAADNRALPLRQRRRALEKILREEGLPTAVSARALMHPACTTEMRLAAHPQVLASNAGYLFNAELDFWQQLPARLAPELVSVIMHGPACPRYIRALRQLTE